MQVESFTARVLPLLVVLIIGIALLSLVRAMTEDRIQENARQRRMAMMSAVLPVSSTADRRGEILELEEPDLTGDGESLYVYKQWTGEQLDGIAFYPVSARGYAGRIVLAVGIKPDGAVSGVRVIEHDETPGIGDRIHQDNSDWLRQFTGLSPGSMQPDDWAIKDDQGTFDALSGATITSRGVINAVHKTADIYAIHRDRFSTSK